MKVKTGTIECAFFMHFCVIMCTLSTFTIIVLMRIRLSHEWRYWQIKLNGLAKNSRPSVFCKKLLEEGKKMYQVFAIFHFEMCHVIISAWVPIPPTKRQPRNFVPQALKNLTSPPKQTKPWSFQYGWSNIITSNLPLYCQFCPIIIDRTVSQYIYENAWKRNWKSLVRQEGV